jgi:hypothetical protein
MTHSKLATTCATVSIASSLAFVPLTAPAAGVIEIDDTKSVYVGGGVRTSFSSVEDAAPNGTDRSNDFDVDDAELYFGGQVTELTSVELSLELENSVTPSDDARVQTAIMKFNFSDAFKLRAGRDVLPLDRANVAGVFFQGAYDYPISSSWPAEFSGRDTGVTIWGHSGGDSSPQFSYRAGVYDGQSIQSSSGGPAGDDSLKYAASFSVNFWDPETSYYTAQTYYGAKDILAVSVNYLQQSDITGTGANSGDFTGYGVGGLFETQLEGGDVVTLDAQYNDFDLDDLAYNATGFPLVAQGSGAHLRGGYMFSDSVGPGQFRPNFSFEELDFDSGGKLTKTFVGTDYVIDAQNSKVSFLIGETDPASGNASSFVKIGYQIMM